jgi:hypothetical protein
MASVASALPGGPLLGKGMVGLVRLARSFDPAARFAGRTAGVAAAGCLASGLLFGAVELLDVGELASGVPAAPPGVAAVAGPVAAAGILVSARRPAGPWRALVAGGGLAMLSATAVNLPFAVLLVVIVLVNRLTGAAGPFDLEPPWLTLAAHLVTLLALVGLVAWLVVDRRLGSGRCLRCGFDSHAPPPEPSPRRRRQLRVLGALAVLAALPYGALKTAWGLGWRGGLVGERFGQVGLATPGIGDTAALTVASIAVSVAMAIPVTHRWVRAACLVVGGLGSVMLLPVGAVGGARILPVLVGASTIGDPELADWVFVTVYGSFAVWGAALTALTVRYWQTTRRPCSRPVRAQVGPATGGRGRSGAGRRPTGRGSPRG